MVLGENIVNDSVTIFRGLLDSSNSLIADPILLYKGNIDTFEILESNNDASVKLTVVSHFLVQMLVWIMQILKKNDNF